MTTDNQHLNDWLDALRSGEYEQGYGEMKIEQRRWDFELGRWDFELGKEVTTSFKFCCLGVACETADATPDTASHMPRWLMDYLGIDDTDQSELVTLNDGKQATFLQIANIIELAYVRKVTITDITRELYPLWYSDKYDDVRYNHEY